MNLKDAIEFVADTAYGHKQMLEFLKEQQSEIEELRDKAIALRDRLDLQIQKNKEILEAREGAKDDTTSTINS